jgi:hypothetical protein
VSEFDKAIAQLLIRAAFFACRSCKYSKVPWQELKRMKQLCLQNIRFFKAGHLLLVPSDSLQLADSVVVTFEVQKNNMKQNTVIHGRTEDMTLCPVVQWAHLVNRIWSYPGAMDTLVCTICHGRLEQISSQHTMAALHALHAHLMEAQSLVSSHWKLASICSSWKQQ